MVQWSTHYIIYFIKAFSVQCTVHCGVEGLALVHIVKDSSGAISSLLGPLQCSAMQCSAMQCRAVQCSAVQCSAVQCSAVQCSAVQGMAVQCSAVQCHQMTIKGQTGSSIMCINTCLAYSCLTALNCAVHCAVHCILVHSTPFTIYLLCHMIHTS